MRGVTFERLMEDGWVRLNVPTPYLPYADGGFRTPSGKCEFYSERMADLGLDPLPTYTPPRELPETAPELAKRYPLTSHLVAAALLPEHDVREHRLAAQERANRSASCIRPMPNGAR